MSNMVVNTNVMALNSHRSLKGVGNAQSKASSRLSSGLRINSAADDAAGLAISEKMRAQIRGLDMASKNAQDAISLVQTAEGGMQEIDNMLQRIRELTVQASNDTNDQASADRVKIQDEITQLVAEIDSMADRVEFNKKKVIDGSFSDGTTAKLSDIASSQPASTQATPQETAVLKLAELQKSDAFVALALAANTDVQGYVAAVEALFAKDASSIDFSDFTDDIMDIALVGSNALKAEQVDSANTIAVANALKEIATLLDPVAIMPTATTVQSGTGSTAVGDAANYSQSLQAVAAQIDGAGATSSVTANTLSAFETFMKNSTQANWDALLAAAKADDTVVGGGSTAVFDAVSGAVDDIIQALADKAALETQISGSQTASTLFFQVGANAQQKLELNINSVKSDSLGIGDGNGNTTIDVNRYTGSEITDLLKGLDDAISYVTSERSKLGAAQNRLEYTIKSLDISSENLSAAESRIRDTDMAKEMMNFTKANVLQQAATSMLAQANQAPQMVLQLLG